MGYFKTLTIDHSAAREYSQRWAQKDQVSECSTRLVSSHGGIKLQTTTTLAQPVNLVRPTQKDQVRVNSSSHLAGRHGGSDYMTATTAASAVPVTSTREHVGRALHAWRKNVEHNPRDLNAVNRAALNLEASPWYLTPDAQLVITSASDSRKRYHVNLDGCDCQSARSGRPCWH